MFKENKYTKWYFKIIDSSPKVKPKTYFESHHIVPRCLGGDNSPENIAFLSARQHFICHLLLTKMHDSAKIKYALICMTRRNRNQTQRYIPNSRFYEMIKKLNSSLASEKFTGKQKHNVGKKRAFNPLTMESRMFFIDDVPHGWVLGNSPKMNETMLGKNLGKIYYNNPITGDVIAVNPDSEIPPGYIKGNPNAATAPSTGTILCYDPISFETSRVTAVPEGWVEGSPFIWITNGKASIQIRIDEEIPKGYYKGRSHSSSHTESIKNSRIKPVKTPLGIFSHPNRFKETYNLSLSNSIFNDMHGSKINAKLLRKNNKTLYEALKNLNYDFSKTKAENGFTFISKEEYYEYLSENNQR